jgi:predicted nucleotidyltransferase
MSIAELPIRIDYDKLAEFCRARGIRKLSLFGSVVRDDFDPKQSDVDVLADFDRHTLAQTGWEYFLYSDELAKILNYKVDFYTQLDLDIEAEIRREALVIYEQA